jgi:hypothetical protein
MCVQMCVRVSPCGPVCIHAWIRGCVRACVCACVCAFVHPCAHPWVRLCACACARPCTHPSVRSCIRACVHAHVHASVRLCAHPCVHAIRATMHTSMHPWDRGTVHLCIRSFARPCVHSSVCACVHACMHMCIRACVRRRLVCSSVGASVSGSSHTLTSFHIWSDYAFAPGLVQTTMRILNHSPIKDLLISMVSLKACHWSMFLCELDMAFLEDVDFEGDIPQPPLIRFLAKHKGLTYIHIRCDVSSVQPRPTRTQYLPFLPNLLSLRTLLAICCNITEWNSTLSNLYSLHVGMSRFDPHDPAFRHLLQILATGDFQKLKYLGLQLEPSLPSTASQTSLNEHDWYGYPACDLRQICALHFPQSWGQLSGDIVCSQPFPSPSLPYPSDRT